VIFKKMSEDEFEQIIYCYDSQVGLKSIIALHSTVLGPAVGGCRMWNYATEEEALTDVLRLSKGMTYKASVAGLNWGGGKAVIIGDPNEVKSHAFLERYGEFVDRLGGHYITAKDVGMNADDLKIIKSKTKHVLGIEGETGSSGDPSIATGFGVYHGMRACAKQAFGQENLKGIKIAMQGLGSVAYYLLEHLIADGAIVVGCDISQAMIDRATQRFSIEVVQPDSIYDVPCDIFSPNALGATLNPSTLPRIKAKVLAGGANNQLSTIEMGHEILRRKLLHAPDYVINAGGLINIYHEAAVVGGYNHTRAFEQVAQIAQTITLVLERSKEEGVPTQLIANQIARERVQKFKRDNHRDT
jgi:leucine dehydrogenase